jgi:tetratricopeptide (TPR) repeat protein
MLRLLYLKHSIIFILCFFLVLSLLEVFIRIFIPQNIVPNYKTFAFGIPNALKANYNEEANTHIYTYQIKTNEKHLRRAKSIHYKKPRNTFRILCLGDSMLFGAGVNNNETLTYYLEKILNERFQEITFEVINAGVPDWSPLEYYLFLKNEGYKYSPDLVLTITSRDDINTIPQDSLKFKNLRYERKSNKEVKIFLDDWEIRPNKRSFSQGIVQALQQSTLYQNLSRSSHLLSLIRYRLNTLFISDKKIKNSASDSLEYFVKNINLKKNEQVVWVTQKSQFTNKRMSAKSIQSYFLIDQISSLAKKMQVNFALANLPNNQEVLGLVNRIDNRDFLSNNMELNLLRPLSKFQKKHLTFLYFTDDNHLTPAGHMLSSLLLFNFLVENQIIPESKTINVAIDITNAKIIKMVKNSNQRIDSKLQNSPKMLFNKAVIYKNRGQFNLAKENITRYIQYSKNDSEAYNILGIIHYKMGDISLAEEYTKKAVKINPNNYWLHLRLSGLYSYNGRHEEALQELEISLELKPDDPKALLLLGETYLRLNNLSQATKIFKTVLSLEPKNKMAIKVLREIERIGLN